MMPRCFGAVCTTVVMFALRPAIADERTQPEYLSDVAGDRMVWTQQGWGGLGLDTGVVPRGKEPTPLRIKDKTYKKGLGHHAPGEIVFALDGEYRTFEADVGVLWQGGGRGSVVFQVYADDQKRFESRVMTDSDPAMAVRVSVAGAQELRLIADDAGDGISCDCANWANARLIRDPAAKARPAIETADMAPFARLMSWDPDRLDGARSHRTQEFRAEDVFLGKEVVPAKDGTVTIPAWSKGRGCIGLEWPERRMIRKLALRFADPARMPPTEGVRVESWVGESAWQGKWQAMPGKIETHGDRWICRVRYAGKGGVQPGIQKVRWILPTSTRPIVLRGLSAYAGSPWQTAELWLRRTDPKAGDAGRIEIYNGQFVSATGGTIEKDHAGLALRCDWDASKELHLKLRYCASRSWKTNRTVVRVRMGETAFGVAVEDVLARGTVDVRDANVLVSRQRMGAASRAIVEKPAETQTILERVREMPDQTFERAMAKVHNPVQNNGPTMLSLACDNRKFVVERKGVIHFHPFADRADAAVPHYTKYAYRLTPRFGSGKGGIVARRLIGEWLPQPASVFADGPVTYEQRACVAPIGDGPAPYAAGWLNRRGVCVAEFAAWHTKDEPVTASVTLSILADAAKGKRATLAPVPGGVVARQGERLLAFVSVAPGGPFKADISDGRITVAGAVPPKVRPGFSVYLPAWPCPADAHAQLGDGEKILGSFRAYWRDVMAPAMQVSVPDHLLMNVIRASQVHCMLTARNEAGGQRIAAWAGADRYGPLESEANAVIRGMSLMGHDAFARRSLDYHIQRYNKAGYLTVGYTIVGTGWHLWTLADHFERERDEAWLKRIAPEVARVCNWIVAQRAKTKRMDARGQKMPEYGLVPPGVAADWNRFAYRFFQEAHYCAGLRDAARVLADAGHPDAARFKREAAEFRDEILRAYRWTRARCPALPLSNGTWVPAYPSTVYNFGNLEDMIPGEDGNRSWCYDVEIGAHHLAVLGVLEPSSADVGRMMDHMEDVWFLHAGMGDYPTDKNRADWFNLGGFAKVQPYYCRNVEICALRDDVKPFIRSYFNTIPSLLNTENLAFWEHFGNRGAWHKPHETGYFLAQTRLMMVMERGDELWLAPFVTSEWLRDGRTVSVRNAPTRFGKVSYRIASVVRQGYIEATIDPPTRTPPERIVLRLRHPEGRAIRAVSVSGEPHQTFDPKESSISIKPGPGPITLRVAF